MTTTRPTPPASAPRDARPAFLGDVVDGDLIMVTVDGESWETGYAESIDRFQHLRSNAVSFRFTHDSHRRPSRKMAVNANVWIIPIPDDNPEMGGTEMSATRKNAAKSVSTESTVAPDNADTVIELVSDVTPDATPAATPTDSTPDMSTPDNAVAAYAAGDAKIKSAVRASIKKSMMACVVAGDIAGAQSWVAAENRLATTRATVATPVDYADVIARRVAALRVAANMIESGTVTPDGVPDDYAHDATDIMSRVESIIESTVTAPDTDDTKSIMKSARTTAATKITKSRDRHDTATYVRRALSKVNIGTPVTVAQLINLGAVDGDDYRPTSGAVTARLKSNNKIDGVKIESIGDRAVLGASRTRDFTPDEIN